MKKVLLFIFSLCLFTSNAWARTATWDGGGSGNLASTAANWDTDTAPVNGDALVFDGTSSKNCTFDISVTYFSTINTTGYSGVVTPTVDMAIHAGITFANNTFAHGSKKVTLIGSQTIAQGTGNPFYDLTFDSGLLTHTLSAALDVDRDLSIVGRTYVHTGGYNITVGGNLTRSGDFDIWDFNEGGAFVLDGSGSQTWEDAGASYTTPWTVNVTVNKGGGTLTINDVTLGSTRTYTNTAGTLSSGASKTLSLVGAATFAGSWDWTIVSVPASTTFNAGSGTHDVSGNFTKVGTFNANTSTFIFSGTSTVDGSSTFNNLSVTGTASFDDADTFSASSCAGAGTYQSDDASNRTDVNCTANTITAATCTRADNSGATITTSGTVTSCTGWTAGGAARGRMILMS